MQSAALVFCGTNRLRYHAFASIQRRQVESGDTAGFMGFMGRPSAGINRQVVGVERALQERRSDSILTSILKVLIAQRGLISMVLGRA